MSQYSIASWNIRKAVGLDWRRNADRIVQVLEEIRADIVILQEADKRLGQRQGVLPLDRLKNEHGYDLAPFAENTVSHGWHGNAVLYGPRISLKNAKRLPIPSLEPRGCVSAHLETDSGHSLEVIGVHLGLTSKAREQQIGYIRQYGENLSAQTPLLVGGDFNEWRQAKKIRAKFGPDYEVISPGPSFHTANPKIALDHFVYKGDLRIHETGVHKTPLTRKASDHLPITMNFEL